MTRRTPRRHAGVRLGILFVTAAALCAGGGCTKPESPPGARTVATQEQTSAYHLDSDLIRGRKVFEEKHCNQCHSIFEPAKKIGPTLQTSRFYGSFLDIFSILWNHAPAMSAYMRREVLDRPQFSAPELNQLVSFLYMLPYLGDQGDARRGEALLREKACLSCHSLRGRGNKEGVGLDSLSRFRSQVVLLQRMWNHGPLMLARMEARGTAVPRFSGSDMQDLFAALTADAGPDEGRVFLGVGNVEYGRKMFNDKGCVKCHSLFGKGGKDGPDLGRAISRSDVTMVMTTLWNHVGGMRGKFREKKLEWPNFSETEMNDLVVFLYSISYEDRSGDAGRGERIFTGRKCIDCHFKTDEDRRKILAAIRSVDSVRFGTLLWNHIPAMEAAMVIRGVPWPEMTGQDLRDVLAFLQSR